ncbi:sugar phosphate isomerase/epimerase [Fictibacillus sp. KIGAM418]|uniref:Sugar phosphate isomerase/epimerase n=1 Tax=Fictibacillus marinisediminis TaxID=2878389 RepID=A0A9X2BJ95_9BACL|nr:TIM barrel protein [Fictibacillus marinisediminis]MCK6259423.1 sugar phosphate isomerase/epimerase [Fictibacillus marinisediminis]
MRFNPYISYHVSQWKHDYLAAFKRISDHGMTSVEMGSAFLQDISLIKSHLDAYGLTLSSVFEFGHFQNFRRKREILMHHSLLAHKMSRLGVPMVILAPGLRYKDTSLSQMYMFIDEITKIYSSYNITTTIHPHFKQCIFFEKDITSLLENVNQPLFLLPDTCHLNLANIDTASFFQRFSRFVKGVHVRELSSILFSFLIDILQKDSWIIIEESEKIKASLTTIDFNIKEVKKFIGFEA